MDNLGKHRKAIDAIDKKIVGLLQARAENVREIANEKNKTGKQVYDPARWACRISSANGSPSETG